MPLTVNTPPMMAHADVTNCKNDDRFSVSLTYNQRQQNCDI